MERNAPIPVSPAPQQGDAHQPAPAPSAPRQAAPMPKHAFTRPEQLLLIGVFVLGLIWNAGFTCFAYAVQIRLYGCFWAAYLVLFYALNFRRTSPLCDGTGETAPLCRNKTAWALAIPALLVCLKLCIFPEQSEPLFLLNLAALPTILMTHMAFSVFDIPVGRELAAVPVAIRGTFVYPFSRIPYLFGAVGSLFTVKTARTRGVLTGLAVGVPLAAVVLLLVSSADQIIGGSLARLFAGVSFADAIGQIVRVLLVMMLFYSFVSNATFQERAALPAKRAHVEPLSLFAVIAGLLLCIYAVFSYVQFRYLFGGRLPAEYTYSEYARQGFTQLLAVAVINFSVYGACLALTRPSALRTAMLYLLVAASGVILASAAMRLLLYIGAYGLTVLRVLALWMIVYLAAMVLLAAVRLWKTRLPLLRVAAFSLIYWYVLLNLPDWATVISRWNSAF